MKITVKKTLQYTLAFVVLLALTITFLELFSSYEVRTAIHENAPVQTKQTITIHAPVSKVWETFTDVNRWASWQAEISSAKLETPFAVGSTIFWETNGFSIQSRLQTVERHQKIGWAGNAFGSFAIHVWSFEERDGNTVVTVEESMEGWLVWMTQDYVQPNLHMATVYWLESLKKESEK